MKRPARLTRWLFWLADCAAWLLLLLAAPLTVIYPLTAPVFARMHGIEPSQPLGTATLLLTVALGAYCLTRRRALGLILIALPGLIGLFAGHVEPILRVGAPWLLVLAAPYLAVYIDISRQAAVHPGAGEA